MRAQSCLQACRPHGVHPHGRATLRIGHETVMSERGSSRGALLLPAIAVLALGATGPAPAATKRAPLLEQRPAIEVGHSSHGLWYEVHGDGPTIVFVHGSNLDLRAWDGEIARWSEEGRAIAYDMRGHGRSELPSEPYSPVDDLAGLLDELDQPRVALVGLSAGAGVALDFALEHPDRVRALLLASPGVGGYRPTEMPPFVTDLVDALQGGDFDRANQVLLDSAVMRAPDRHRPLVEEMVRGNRDLWTIPRGLVQQLDPPAIGRLAELSMPITVVVGGDDSPDTLRQAELIVEHAADARLHVIPGGGHLVNLTSEKELAAILDAFFRAGRAPE